ncbi:copper resistance system multicopper oxidase [Novosphingobium sp. KCTC 2891]|uniref:copper resistance system multicopper oxidase n=1 Tax=Novosphingobium sp. KCTC 2891 TaxID=2989730 RepID=UPI0022239AD4|nr:copper resistance system multicopper oxidase [Novosphingobium sp. KCTC 2891]MCW1382523.1 copper resistance system multicopper oxidase [Novosphingobium sp. KCTC 2891]
MNNALSMARRDLLRIGAVGGLGVGLGAMLPAWAQPVSPGLPTLSGEDITLRIARGSLAIDGKAARAVTINGTVPGPLLRLRQGQNLRLTVENELDEDTSLHWHGLLLPFQMDGVPGVSFPGIKAGGRFTYEFPIVQAGTYWYHSHSGLQEMMGQYAPIVIDPAGGERVQHDREHVILLSDHSFVHPATILRKLKAEPGYYNYQRQTLSGLLAGKDQPLHDRLAWGRMRMDPTDIADVTGAVMSYLVNGHGPRDNWTALFAPGERVRLRFINAAAMTAFNVRIPGLAFDVVAADGQDVRPVTVDEFQFSPGETYDVIVRPQEDRAFAIVGESMDRSGMAVATLAPRAGMRAAAPALRQRPLLTMKDMGMEMDGMDMAGMSMRDPANAPQVRMGPGVDMINPMPMDRTGDPGIGLDDAGHRVLTYKDLVALDPNPDTRAPAREIQVHLTGSMDRYMWSMDGKTMSEAHEPLPIRTGERVRFTLVNDTMMAHPIHLHGHLFELVTGHGDHAPRKHTVNVLPGGKVSWDVTGIAGDWAFHCHLFLHMVMGMMRIVQVRPVEGGAT